MPHRILQVDALAQTGPTVPLHTRIHTHVRVHETHTHTHTHTQQHTPHRHTHTHTHTKAHAQTRAHTQAHGHTRTHTHTHNAHARCPCQVEGTCSGQYGYIVCVTAIHSVTQGKIRMAGSGLATFKVSFGCVTFRPFKGEVLDCIVTSVNKVGGARARAFVGQRKVRPAHAGGSRAHGQFTECLGWQLLGACLRTRLNCGVQVALVSRGVQWLQLDLAEVSGRIQLASGIIQAGGWDGEAPVEWVV